jgi:OHCU decarboxylase
MDQVEAMTLLQLNTLSRDEFVRLVGPVFEHSPWIAGAGWAERPFENLEELHAVLCAIVRQAGEARQVELIQAHPDLVGRAALAGVLTTESSREQASAGLDRLSAGEIAAFQACNDEYRNKFGFPFVICARLNKKDAILAGFQSRLNHSREQEIMTALLEIFKIARLRLQDIISA